MDNGKYAERGIDLAEYTKAKYRILLEELERSDGRLRVVEVHMRGNKRVPYFFTTLMNAEEFERCTKPMGRTFNLERRRGVNEEGKKLAI